MIRGRLSLSEYERPKKTKTESVQDQKSIQQLLNDYVEVSSDELPYIPINTHLRYISWNIKNKCEQFRYGGLLVRVEKQYLILAGKEGKTFSAQRFTINQNNNKVLHTTRFFKKLKKEELIQEELEETLDASKEIINKQNEMLEKQQKEIDQLKKLLKKR
jgi:hypothetical protein